VLAAAAALRPVQTVVVTGHGGAAVRRHLGLTDDQPGATLTTVTQTRQLGTGHAVIVALPSVQPQVTTVIILYADTPLVTPETLTTMVATRAATGAALAMVTCQAADPAGYGRVVRDAGGQITGIVEEKAATPAERAITEINAGIYAVDAAWLRDALPRLQHGPTGEALAGRQRARGHQRGARRQRSSATG
jgi:bifunctional UDP-N-acetylglucosamine pyrophosphorylase/glucosamine-1-phosphate N-acetyltransferase